MPPPKENNAQDAIDPLIEPAIGREVDYAGLLHIADAVVPPQEELGEPPGRVLIVEDDALIGIDIETLLQRVGVSDTVVVGTVAQALDQLDQTDFDYVLLDLNLGAETGFPVADALQRRRVPFAFATGYGQLVDMGGKFVGVPILPKPYNERDLRRALGLHLA